jgi:hypothetical protein
MMVAADSKLPFAGVAVPAAQYSPAVPVAVLA